MWSYIINQVQRLVVAALKIKFSSFSSSSVLIQFNNSVDVVKLINFAQVWCIWSSMKYKALFSSVQFKFCSHSVSVVKSTAESLKMFYVILLKSYFVLTACWYFKTNKIFGMKWVIYLTSAQVCHSEFRKHDMFLDFTLLLLLWF